MARFLLDADVNPTLAPLLRANGHDVLITNEASRHDATDYHQLLLATDSGCILITHDKKDYLLLSGLWRRLAARWEVSPESHAGVLILPQQNVLTYPRSVSELEMLLASRQELAGRVSLLEPKWGWRDTR